MGEKKVSIADVEALIPAKRGNVAAIARSLGVSRGTVLNRVNESATLRRLLDDEREGMIDDAESELYEGALNGDTAKLIFFLKTQGRHRGYGDRIESAITGSVSNVVVYLPDNGRSGPVSE